MKIDHQFYTILMLQMVVEAIRLICQNITSLINPLLDKIELPEHVCVYPGNHHMQLVSGNDMNI